MLYLNPNKEKILTFDVELSGASLDEVHGFVRFFIDEDVQLGFPVLVTRDQIRAVIAPLKNLIKKPIKSGEIFESQLDLYTDNEDYFRAWKGQIEIHAPAITIEAKLTQEDDERRPKRSGGGVKRKTISESRNDKKIVSKAKLISERKIVRQPIKKRTPKQIMENLTEEQVFNLMEKLGTTTPRIKQILYDQASTQAKSGKPVDVLKEIIKIMGKKKVMKRSRS